VKRENHLLMATAVGALAFTLAACDAGPSAGSRASAAPPPAQVPATQTAAADPRDAPVPLLNGKPMWAPNRKHTAQENADYQFNKNGKDFGAVTEADYVAKAHAFVDAPPAGVKRIDRPNGDAVLYDAKSNTFAVVTKTGAPRTMFKPKTGAAYWREQAAREADQSRGQSES
jgi:hypothetical protein